MREPELGKCFQNSRVLLNRQREGGQLTRLWLFSGPGSPELLSEKFSAVFASGSGHNLKQFPKWYCPLGGIATGSGVRPGLHFLGTSSFGMDSGQQPVKI